MDLGKVTVFSGSPQQQSSPTLPTSLYLQLVLQLDDMAVVRPPPGNPMFPVAAPKPLLQPPLSSCY